MGSYVLGWLRPMEPIYPSSRPLSYLIVPWRFRFGRALTCPKLDGTVDAGGCNADSLSRGCDPLGGSRRNRSGVLKARVIVVPPWDSPTTRGCPAGLGGIAGIIISSLLFPGVSFCSISAILLLCSAWFVAISAALAPVNDRADTLP